MERSGGGRKSRGKKRGTETDLFVKFISWGVMGWFGRGEGFIIRKRNQLLKKGEKEWAVPTACKRIVLGVKDVRASLPKCIFRGKEEGKKVNVERERGKNQECVKPVRDGLV